VYYSNVIYATAGELVGTSAIDTAKVLGLFCWETSAVMAQSQTLALVNTQDGEVLLAAATHRMSRYRALQSRFYHVSCWIVSIIVYDNGTPQSLFRSHLTVFNQSINQ